MMVALGVVAAAVVSLVCATLSFSLRDFSRARLEDKLIARGRPEWLDRIIQHQQDLMLITAAGRMLANLALVIGCLHLAASLPLAGWAEFLLAVFLATIVGLVFSVILPTALANHLAETAIVLFIRPLHAVRVLFRPITALFNWVDRLVHRAVGSEMEPEQIEKDILSVVEDGEKEGVVDEQEREMIESVIEFRDTQAGQIMTARPDIVALEVGASLEEVRRTLEESGHSRIPVYEGTLDHIAGVLYARDLLKYLGAASSAFDIRAALRPPIFVPEGKPLRDLLLDFRLQKVHIAIVLDEYGGTAGLVTIEDILEELVGEISDEHEPQEPPMLKRLGDTAVEADARLRLEDVNRELGLSLPEDAGFETLGGYVSTMLGQIPPKGMVLETDGIRFTVLEAEPHRVKRLRIDLLSHSTSERPS